MNAKIYNGNVQPNHKEYKIWVNDEGIIKTWNGTEWVEQSGGSGESGGSSNGSNLKYLPKYYSIDWSVADEMWKTAVNGGEMPPTKIVATIKSGGLITPSDFNNPETIEAFSFLPVGFQDYNTFNVTIFETLESTIDYFKTRFNITISMNGIKEISEEEYYSFDIPES